MCIVETVEKKPIPIQTKTDDELKAEWLVNNKVKNLDGDFDWCEIKDGRTNCKSEFKLSVLDGSFI